ncbi:MAG: ABC-type branched-chain amino acid transport system, ATPase component [Acidimicrobiales bacterium]|nr:ABC-type branched-chain amino acid transport system, ATPase component [Acidimicrobiales bacterium]
MPLLQVDEVSVRFGGVMANQGVNLHADAGRITGLIGPNGAGKTTMFNVITGLQDPTEGRVLVDDKDVTALKPHKRARLGLARTFQRLEVFGSLSARDNVLVAAEIRKRWARDGSDPKAVAEEVLERVGITHVAGERVDAMPTGMARLVELARALAARPRLLLLDEPGSGLDESETEAFGGLLLDLAREGLGMLLVEHDVDLVMRVCDLIFVLDFGRIIAVGTPTEIQHNPDVQAAYLGAEDPDDADHAAEELTHS